jgi:hypothetical protein
MSVRSWRPPSAGKGHATCSESVRGTIGDTMTTPTAQPTHPCVRCGARIAVEIALCEACNPLGLKDPASSQVHGIAFVAIAAAVIALALIGRFALSGIGPFSATVVGSSPSGGALSVTIALTNEGSAVGQSRCRLYDPSQRAAGPSARLLSPQVGPGQTLSFSTTVTEFGSTPRELAVECRSP